MNVKPQPCGHAEVGDAEVEQNCRIIMEAYKCAPRGMAIYAVIKAVKKFGKSREFAEKMVDEVLAQAWLGNGGDDYDGVVSQWNDVPLAMPKPKPVWIKPRTRPAEAKALVPRQAVKLYIKPRRRPA